MKSFLLVWTRTASLTCCLVSDLFRFLERGSYSVDSKVDKPFQYAFDNDYVAILPEETTMRQYIAQEEYWLRYREQLVDSGQPDPARLPFAESIYNVHVGIPTTFNIYFSQLYPYPWIVTYTPSGPTLPSSYRTFPHPINASSPPFPPRQLLISPSIGGWDYFAYIPVSNPPTAIFTQLGRLITLRAGYRPDYQVVRPFREFRTV